MTATLGAFPTFRPGASFVYLEQISFDKGKPIWLLYADHTTS